MKGCVCGGPNSSPLASTLSARFFGVLQKLSVTFDPIAVFREEPSNKLAAVPHATIDRRKGWEKAITASLLQLQRGHWRSRRSGEILDEAHARNLLQ